MGTVRELDLQDGFVDKVLSIVDHASIAPLKVIVDTGNGMVGPSLERVFDRLPVDLTCLLYTSPSPRDRYISRMPSSA